MSYKRGRGEFSIQRLNCDGFRNVCAAAGSENGAAQIRRFHAVHAIWRVVEQNSAKGRYLAPTGRVEQYAEAKSNHRRGGMSLRTARERRPILGKGPEVVTILFTDIEGSTSLWEQDGARMSQALAAHDALMRRVVEARHGTVVKMTGDGMHAVFGDALDALAATVDLQRALADPAATNGVTLRVRCGLHAGAVERRDNDYFGSPVNRAARIMSAAHGGQILLSQAVVDTVREMLPASVSLRDLGRVRLKDLSTPERVYQVVHPQLRQEFPALRSLEATPNNLPHQVTSFVGRESALVDLQRLLTGTRLLTLTGSGGCGKTRLCLQLAADSLERFPDGAWLVELAPLADPDLVPQTVASVLGLKGEPGKPIVRSLVLHLEDKRVLLLLDNCEHLLHACAQLVATLVRQCPQVTLLASSREALGIGGEQAYRVPSLSLPDPKQEQTRESVVRFEAVQLFTDRALLARPDFQVTQQNAAALASICHRLDGIPLAIELAAARVRSLSVEEINRKLDQRFQLLTGGSRTALPRQQTLRSLIDWSYDLLSDREAAGCCSDCPFLPAAGHWKRPSRFAPATACGTGSPRSADVALRQEPGGGGAKRRRLSIPAAGDGAAVCPRAAVDERGRRGRSGAAS